MRERTGSHESLLYIYRYNILRILVWRYYEVYGKHPRAPKEWSSHVCFVDLAATNWGNSCAMLSVTQFLPIDRPILIPNLESERIPYERIDTQVRILVKKDELTLEGANELHDLLNRHCRGNLYPRYPSVLRGHWERGPMLIAMLLNQEGC